jgi:pilus assembly protein FimV
VRIFPYKTWVSVVALALMPWMGHAAGLGKLTILSALGEPLNAEIELLSVSKDELATLSARLASPEAFQQAKIPYSPALVGVRFSIDKRADGQPYLRIVSTRPVNEPFIDFLIELNWASGRLLREYTGLVDPPGFGKAPEPVAPIVVAPPAVPQPQPQPAASAPQTISPPPQPAATAPKTTVATEKPAATPVRPSTAAPRADARQYGPIKRGETLTGIATGIKPEGVTLEQMLVSLYRHNSDAFDGNMNRMKTGRILRVPEAEQISATPSTDATREVRVHAANWNSYRQKLADAANQTPARETASAASGKIATTVEDKAAAKTPAKEVVRISKGEPSASAAPGKGASSAARIRALEEEAVARQKALSEANERIAQLEKTIKDMQRLLEVKGQVPAAKPPAPKPEAAPPAKPEAVAKAEPPKVEPPKAEPAKAEPAKVEPAKAAPPEPPKADVKAVPGEKPVTVEPVKGEAPKTEVAKAEPKPKPKVVPPPPPPEVSLVDEIMGEPLYLAGGGLGIAALGGFGYWFVRRRRTEGAEAGGAPAAKAGKAPAATGVAPATAMPVVGGVDDVDALQEADLYLSFGRDAQAEAVLKDELQKNPTREDVQLKLLEVYAARKDKAQFEAVARNLNTQTSGVGDNWLKAAAMGFAFDSDNPLYEAGKSAPPITPLALGGAATAGTDLDFDLDLSAPAAAPKADVDLEMVSGDAAAVTDFPLGTAVDTESTVMLEPGELKQTVEAVTADSASPRATAAGPSIPDFTLSVPAESWSGAPDLLLEVPEAKAEAQAKPDIMLEAPAAEPAKTDVALEAGVPAGNLIDFNFELPDQTGDRFKREVAKEAGTPVPSVLEKAEVPALDLDLSGDNSPELKAAIAQAAAPAIEPERAATPALDLDLSGDNSPELRAAIAQVAAPAVEPDIKLDPGVAAAATTTPALGPDVKLDLESVEMAPMAPARAEAPAAAAAPGPAIPDINLDDIDLSLEDAPKVEVPKHGEGAKDDRWYDVQTKFDLAKAYQEMGDKDGAREILEEVIKEGDPGQQAEAKEMLATLA